MSPGRCGAQQVGAARAGGPGRRRAGAQRSHRLQQLLPLGLGERGQQRRDFLLRALLQRREGAPAGRAQAEVLLARVAVGAGGAHQAAFLQPAQQPAQVAGVEVQPARQRTDGRAVGFLGMCELPQHAGLGQAVGRLQQAFVQHADAARVEAVEPPDGLDAVASPGEMSIRTESSPVHLPKATN
jgi:hypothetical protein